MHAILADRTTPFSGYDNDNQAIAKARGELAKYMSKLERHKELAHARAYGGDETQSTTYGRAIDIEGYERRLRNLEDILTEYASRLRNAEAQVARILASDNNLNQQQAQAYIDLQHRVKALELVTRKPPKKISVSKRKGARK